MEPSLLKNRQAEHIQAACCTCACRYENDYHRKTQHVWYMRTTLMTLALTLCFILPVVHGQKEWTSWTPWRKPWENYHSSVVVDTKSYGKVEGYSVPWHIDDTYWSGGDGDQGGEYPMWYLRRINCFLGVPFALPPVGYYRFRRSMPPRWKDTWKANFFRPACPQTLDEIRKDIPDFPKSNVSEDCLYMNIFVPNITTIENDQIKPDRTKYPVIVWIHSGDFSSGTAQQQPGHVLVTREVVVVTFNYRLGALGFLSTEDEHGAGNWGFLDQLQALKFIKEVIADFRGDPNQITIMGDGAGAVSVGLHLLSPLSRDRGYYHQAAMMSGTDLSPFGFVDPYWQPRKYAEQIAELLGCPTHHSFDMMECLRNNITNPWQRVLEMQQRVVARDAPIGMAWGPVQDGLVTYPRKNMMGYVFPETPLDMRRRGDFAHIPTMVGQDTNAGAQIANNSVKGLEGGMLEPTYRHFVNKLLTDWRIIDIYRERVSDAIQFQYTYWPDPENTTARGQMYINMVTDLEFGKGMDSVVKIQSEYQPTYMYEFNYKSWNDWAPKYMGVVGSAAVAFVFGFPFMNETILNETELIPRQWYDYEDRNMSDWMMYMWTNFAKYGEPTPNITRNVTWAPYNSHNLSYLVIDWHSHTWFRYRQDFYGFWKEYFPSYARQDYLFPTATPTPAGYAYVYSTGAVSTLFILLLCGIVLLAYLLWYQKQQEDIDDAYRHADIPLSSALADMQRSHSSQALSTVSQRTPVTHHSVV